MMTIMVVVVVVVVVVVMREEERETLPSSLAPLSDVVIVGVVR